MKNRVVAILAGGMATRLGEKTRDIPKSLLEVAGRPFILHQLEFLRRRGLCRVVLCVGHLGENIREIVGDGSAFGMEVQYSFDGPKLLGTGGALKRAAPFLGDSFFVLYGDSYVDFDYAAAFAAFERSGRPGLMTVYHNEGRHDRSNVEFSAGRVVRYDKKTPTPSMRHIDYGVGILRRSVLDQIPEGESFDLADVYSRLVTQGQLEGFEVPDRFYEIGSPGGLEEFRKILGSAEVNMSYAQRYLDEAVSVASKIDPERVEQMVEMLATVRSRGGRLFFLGVGGSAANASHAVNDVRKICGIEAYTPTDNVSELTARINDDGWETSYERWLMGSRLTSRDAVFVLSVGGGDKTRNVSVNLVRAIDYAKQQGAAVLGVVGRDGGHTARMADACVIVPTASAETVTAHTEAFQSVVCHLLVSHPRLRASEMKWESLASPVGRT